MSAVWRSVSKNRRENKWRLVFSEAIERRRKKPRAGGRQQVRSVVVQRQRLLKAKRREWISHTVIRSKEEGGRREVKRGKNRKARMKTQVGGRSRRHERSWRRRMLDGKENDGGEWKLVCSVVGKVLRGPTSSPPRSLVLALHRRHKRSGQDTCAELFYSLEWCRSTFQRQAARRLQTSDLPLEKKSKRSSGQWGQLKQHGQNAHAHFNWCLRTSFTHRGSRM